MKNKEWKQGTLYTRLIIGKIISQYTNLIEKYKWYHRYNRLLF